MRCLQWIGALLILLTFPGYSQTWGTWNGTTVGSASGNISGMNGKTIGTAAGNYNKWNNLAASGSTPSGVSYANLNCGSGSGSGSTISCTVSGVAAGSTIFVDVAQFTYPSTSPTLTDTGSGTIVQVLSPTVLTTAYPNSSSVLFVVENAGAGTHTLTATYPGSISYPAIVASVLTGASITSPVDSSAGLGNISSGTNTACGSLTTSVSGEFVLAFSHLPGGGTFGVGTSPISMTMVATSGDNFEYGTAGASGTTNATWSNSVNYECDSVVVH